MIRFTHRRSVLAAACLLGVLLTVGQAVAQQRILLGASFPDFEATDAITEEPIDRSDFNNDVFLVHFWAAWNTESLRQIADLRWAYNKFADDGLEIVSISLDADRQAFRNAVRRHRMEWHNIFEGGGRDTRLAKEFSIVRIPRIFVVNREGTVVADTPATGSDLIALVERLLVGEKPMNDLGGADAMIVDEDALRELERQLESIVATLRDDAESLINVSAGLYDIDSQIDDLYDELPPTRLSERLRTDYRDMRDDLKDVRRDLFMYGFLDPDDLTEMPRDPFKAVDPSGHEFHAAKRNLPTARSAVREMRSVFRGYEKELQTIRDELRSIQRQLRANRGDREALQQRFSELTADIHKLALRWVDPWKQTLRDADERFAELAELLPDSAESARKAIDDLVADVTKLQERLETVEPNSRAERDVRREYRDLCERALDWIDQYQR